MPSYPHIEQYRTKLQELIEFGGSDNEENIRPAFQNCLDAYCHDHRERLVLIPELKNSPSNKPDGTVKDSLRMARGYWEAKDSHDDLDAEIKVKFNRGYPRDNIIFEDSQTAVLVQNGNEAMRVDMSREGELHRLIRIFLDYELPEIQEFRHAQSQFKTDLPTVLENLRATVAEAEAKNQRYQAAAESFLELCRKTIGPAVSPADVQEMLLQHILTKDIFQRVFAEDQFHRENNVARQLDALERTFFTGDVRRQAIDRLRAYYGVIGRAVDEIADYAEKQQFLKAIYEDFYTAYNPAAADRLGVVYTPNEVVDFIIRGVDHLLEKHFGKTLADDNVQILDPATGTGTFITTLINHLPADRLEHKYLNEIHANEVAILPYYIGNPPYNDRQANWNEFNPNRPYPEVDRRIRDTYVKEGNAQRTHQYDMYKRFLRWASDRLDDDGIIGVITNRAYLDTYQDDGFRKVASEEFTDIYVMDLGSDVRRNPKIAGTTHNVFGIQTGVAISFFVRDKAKSGACGIHYARREDSELAKDKLAYLQRAELEQIAFQDIAPDQRNDWLTQSQSGFARLIPLATRATKFAKKPDDEQAVFRLFSSGVKTDRDEWVFDFDIGSLRAKALFFADTYNALLDAKDESYDPSIKWSRDLRNEFKRGRRIVYSDAKRVRSLYRPFALKHHFADFTMNDVLTRNHYEMFGQDLARPNRLICVRGLGTYKPFDVMATDRLVEHQLLMNMQCLPLYRYTEDGERVSNITRCGIDQINGHYQREWGDDFQTLAGEDGITAEQIFAYTYAVLHDPAYRHEYAMDLLREFPRLSLYPDFHHWAQMGQKLLDLHIGFESAETYPAGALRPGGR